MANVHSELENQEIKKVYLLYSTNPDGYDVHIVLSNKEGAEKLLNEIREHESIRPLIPNDINTNDVSFDEWEEKYIRWEENHPLRGSRGFPPASKNYDIMDFKLVDFKSSL